MKDARKHFTTGLMSVIAFTMVAQPAWAVRTRVHEMAESPVYKQKAPGMIGRGALNGVTFFVDTIVNTVNETRSGPPLIGTLTGLGKGLGCSTLRLGSGAIDIVSFWVPGFNGFPVSDSYDNCLAYNGPEAAPTGYSNEHERPMAVQPSEPAPADTGYDYNANTSSAPTAPAESHRKWSK